MTHLHDFSWHPIIKLGCGASVLAASCCHQRLFMRRKRRHSVSSLYSQTRECLSSPAEWDIVSLTDHFQERWRNSVCQIVFDQLWVKCSGSDETRDQQILNINGSDQAKAGWPWRPCRKHCEWKACADRQPPREESLNSTRPRKKPTRSITRVLPFSSHLRPG